MPLTLFYTAPVFTNGLFQHTYIHISFFLSPHCIIDGKHAGRSLCDLINVLSLHGSSWAAVFSKGAFIPPDKCEVIDQFFLFVIDCSAPSLCSQVNSGGVRGWVAPLTCPPSISDCVSSAVLHTHTHTRRNTHARKMNDSPCPLYPHLWSRQQFWLILKCCKVRAGVCVYLVLADAVR